MIELIKEGKRIYFKGLPYESKKRDRLEKVAKLSWDREKKCLYFGFTKQKLLEVESIVIEINTEGETFKQKLSQMVEIRSPLLAKYPKIREIFKAKFKPIADYEKDRKFRCWRVAPEQEQEVNSWLQEQHNDLHKEEEAAKVKALNLKSDEIVKKAVYSRKRSVGEIVVVDQEYYKLLRIVKIFYIDPEDAMSFGIFSDARQLWDHEMVLKPATQEEKQPLLEAKELSELELRFKRLIHDIHWIRAEGGSEDRPLPFPGGLKIKLGGNEYHPWLIVLPEDKSRIYKMDYSGSDGDDWRMINFRGAYDGYYTNDPQSIELISRTVDRLQQLGSILIQKE